MRQWALVNQDGFCNSDMQKAIARHFRFRWPFDFEDIYCINRDTGLFHFSDTFLARMDDISCFTLEHEFFDLYPGLAGSIGYYEPTASLIKPSTYIDGRALADLTGTVTGSMYEDRDDQAGEASTALVVIPQSQNPGRSHSDSTVEYVYSSSPSTAPGRRPISSRVMKAKHWNTILG